MRVVTNMAGAALLVLVLPAPHASAQTPDAPRVPSTIISVKGTSDRVWIYATNQRSANEVVFWTATLHSRPNAQKDRLGIVIRQNLETGGRDVYLISGEAFALACNKASGVDCTVAMRATQDTGPMGEIGVVIQKNGAAAKIAEASKAAFLTAFQASGVVQVEAVESKGGPPRAFTFQVDKPLDLPRAPSIDAKLPVDQQSGTARRE